MPAPGWQQQLQAAWLKRGPLAWALLPLSLPFGLLAWARRRAYRAGWLHSQRLPVPVLVVGNLLAGGAGKTPTVLALVELLRRHGWQPGIISRGFGRSADSIRVVQPDTPVAECGDEPLLLRLRAQVPVVVGRDRVAAGQALLQHHPAVDVLVSDDGLQHLRLARDLQVLVFDERGVGNGWPLPAGPLREGLPRCLSALGPAPTLVVYNSPAASTRLPGHLARRGLGGLVPLADWWQGRPAQPAALAELVQRGQPVLAAAGVARPGRFFGMLRAAGLSLVPLPLPDHFAFDTLPWPADTPELVLTEKDAVKLPPHRVGHCRVWVAPLDFGFDAAFEQALLAALPRQAN